MKSMNITYNHINNIRMKLLLFIDKEIQSNKKKDRKLNFIKQYDTENIHQIELEETYYEEKEEDHEIIISPFKLDSFILPKKRGSVIITSKTKIINSISPIFNKNTFSKNININNKNNNRFRKTVLEKNNNHFKKPTQIHHKRTVLGSAESCDTVIKLKEKEYSIRRTNRISSVVKIYNEQKKDALYLKNLCNSIKLKKIDNKIDKNPGFFFDKVAKSTEAAFVKKGSNCLIFRINKKKRGESTCKNEEDIKKRKTKTKMKSIIKKPKKYESANKNVKPFRSTYKVKKIIEE